MIQASALLSRFLQAEMLRRIVRISLIVLWVSFFFSTALMQVAFYVALSYWVLLKWREGWRVPKIELRVAVPLFLYFGVCLLSLVWSEYPHESRRGILKIVKQVFSFLLAADVFRTRAELKALERMALVSLALLIGDGAVQYLWGKDLIRGVALQDSASGGRISASFKTYGLLASYLICAIPWIAALGISAWKEGRRTAALLPGALAAGGVVLLVLTRSRGALLAFAAGIFFASLFSLSKKKLVIFVVAAACAGYFLLPKNYFIHRDIQGKEQSVSERFLLWERATSVIRAKPWTGTGLNTYSRAHERYDKRRQPKLLPIRGTNYQARQNPDGSVSFVDGDLEWRSDPEQKQVLFSGTLYQIQKNGGDYFLASDIAVRSYYAHNGYLQLAAETGLPSLVFFLLFLFFEALGALGRGRSLLTVGIWAGLVSFLAMACVDTVLHNPQAVMVFWFLLGLERAYRATAVPQA